METKKCKSCSTIKTKKEFYLRAGKIVGNCRDCHNLKYRPRKIKNLIEEIDSEIWKDVVNYEGHYKISNKERLVSCGRYVYSKKNNSNSFFGQKILKQGMSVWGYPQCILSKNGTQTTFRIHRLVATAFIPNPENKPQVNHINGIKTDNRPENLEWCTAKENTIHAHKTGLCNVPKGENSKNSKLTEQKVLAIRRLYRINPNVNQTKLAIKLNVSTTIIHMALKRKSWKYLH